MKQVTNNRINIVLCFLSTYIFSVSIGINAVALPQFMEYHEAFGNLSISINLSLESFCAMGISLYSIHIIRLLGLKLALFFSALLRFFPLFFMLFITEDVISWTLLMVCLGSGTFFFLQLLHLWINSIQLSRFKGMVYALFGTLISLGIASGSSLHKYLVADPFQLLNLIEEYVFVSTTLDTSFISSAIIGLTALIPIVVGLFYMPKLDLTKKGIPIKSIIKKNKSILFAVALCGISFFGVSWYISIYGTRNGFSIADASLLLSAFMLGSVCLDTPLSWLSEYLNRRYMLVFSALACTVLCIFLPLAIYDFLQALILLFIWGGIISSMYSNCLFLMEERYQKEDSISAIAAFSFMENFGATIGLLFIGMLLPLIGTDGFSYVIILANICYFSYVMIQYEVET